MARVWVALTGAALTTGLLLILAPEWLDNDVVPDALGRHLIVVMAASASLLAWRDLFLPTAGGRFAWIGPVRLAAACVGVGTGHAGIATIAAVVATLRAEGAGERPRTIALLLAILGIVVLTVALPNGWESLVWRNLRVDAARSDPALLTLSGIFLLAGLGGLAGLPPLRDATPATSLGPIIGLCLAVMVLVRLRSVIPDAGPALMAFGLAGLWLGAWRTWHAATVREAAAAMASAQAGLVVTAIGLGSIAAALLHLTALVAAWITVGLAASAAERRRGGDALPAFAGVLAGREPVGLALVGGLIALAALPPFGLFGGAMLILSRAIPQTPVAGAILAAGLVALIVAAGRVLQPICFSPPAPETAPVAPTASVLSIVPLALTLLLGVLLPASVFAWFGSVAETLR